MQSSEELTKFNIKTMKKQLLLLEFQLLRGFRNMLNNALVLMFIFQCLLLIAYPIRSEAQNLYGLTSGGGTATGGGGVLFKYIPSTATYTNNYNFRNDLNNPYYPEGSLLFASDGNLWGTTVYGGTGTGNRGVIFKSTLAGALSIVVNFTAYDTPNYGGFPYGGTLIQASDGLLYGVTYSGGTNGGDGVLFKCTTGGAYTPLKHFHRYNSDCYGALPWGGLLQANDGNLYGMTTQGGTNIDPGGGLIFQYNITTSAYKMVLNFNDPTAPYYGLYPYGSLIQASDGMLYGMTSQGGTNSNKGVLFQYDITSGSYNAKIHFDGTNNGSSPVGSLFQANDGNIYGMTSQGGANGMGVLFKYVPGATTVTKIRDFASATGGYPDGNLMQASDGNLYGMTSARGSGALNNGVIFQYNLSTSVYSDKIDFTGTSGTYPGASPLYNSALTDVCNPTIYGPVTACQGSTGNVYTTQPGLSGYAWTVSAGGTITGGGATYQATVNWGTSGTQTVSVSYTNGSLSNCGTNKTTLFNVKVNPTSVSGGTAAASPNPVCYGYNTTLSLSGNTAGTTTQWQSSPDNSTWSNISGAITGGITATTYYRAIVTGGTCASATSAVATVTVNTLPSATISYSGTPYCSNSSTVTVSRTGTAGGTYTSSPSGLTINGATGTVTPGTSTANAYTVTYTIAASGGCPAVYATTPITINLLPTSPSSPALSDKNNFCSDAGSTLNLSATGGSGTTLQWYSGGCGSGTTIGSGTPLNISEPTVTTTYYARWESTGCANSTCAPVTVTVITAPTAPASASTDANNFYSNAGGTLNLSATGGSGTTLQWYSGGCGSGTTIGSGSPLNIPKPTASTTYYARWETVGCTSTSCVTVPVTVLPPTSPLNVGVAINTAGDPANQCAIFDVSSTAQGMLIPRMTTAQRDGIYSPINSLLIFNTTTQCFEAYKASTSTWVTFGCLGF